MRFHYIPMIAKKEPSDIFIQKIRSAFYCSFPPFIEKGKLTTLGMLFAVGLAVSCATYLLRSFCRSDKYD